MNYYTIVRGSITEIAPEVERMLKEGWKLLGGVAMCKAANAQYIVFAQAMVKE